MPNVIPCRRSGKTLLQKYRDLRANFTTAWNNWSKSGRHSDKSFAFFSSFLPVQYLYIGMVFHDCAAWLSATICRTIRTGAADSNAFPVDSVENNLRVVPKKKLGAVGRADSTGMDKIGSAFEDLTRIVTREKERFDKYLESSQEEENDSEKDCLDELESMWDRIVKARKRVEEFQHCDDKNFMRIESKKYYDHLISLYETKSKLLYEKHKE